ncbi:amylo-alpha-1,6-glucosidase [Paenibacillus sp. GCM10027628]|uniref:amylo-alpha-1,6-glucosidase n=1 Tax=Paenibacillus sp. GCM10027628 TaxID=3273413 RepID=UPI00363A42BF
MLFQLSEVPFSRFGSFLAVTESASNGQDQGIYIKSVRGGDEKSGLLFRMEATWEGLAVPYGYQVTPALLELETDWGRIAISFLEHDVIRIQGQGIGLRLIVVNDTYDYAIPMGNFIELNSYSKERRYALQMRHGQIEMDAPWEHSRCRSITFDICPVEEKDSMELLIHEYEVVPRSDFQECASNSAEAHFQSYLAKTPTCPPEYQEARELAAYITWSCVVEPEGYLPRRAMYMSKNWMTNIWSWDHCFNTMALVHNDPELAWDQFMIFFDRQHESGMLADFMNDKYALWNGCKPPIHGWTLAWMMKQTDWITDERVQDVYEPLARWTNFWFRYRDTDHDGIPAYNHGNDSGWDNSTIFHLGVPLESPDLCAFLVLQMDVLGQLAQKLGLHDEASRWNQRSEEMLQAMLKHFWNGEAFEARLSVSRKPSVGDSLQLFLPIVLGSRLPEDVVKKLLIGLKQQGRFLTEHGFATESVSSEFYKADGYWRGPIWAPSTMLIVEGLKACGEHEFALDIAERFCRMAAKSGMAENYDAQTGEGLRDRAFTWTSSVFLILANELFQAGRT